MYLIPRTLYLNYWLPDSLIEECGSQIADMGYEMRDLKLRNWIQVMTRLREGGQHDCA